MRLSAAWRPLAEQGDADAQFNLGLMYGAGKDVPQDCALAHMWLNIAAANGIKDAAEGRGRLASNMTLTQIAEAQKLAREWMVKH